MLLLAVSVYEMRGWRIGTERGGVVAILCVGGSIKTVCVKGYCGMLNVGLGGVGE